MVTTRIPTTRRRPSSGRQARPTRRRRTAWPLLATVSGRAGRERLRLSSFARTYAAAAALLTVACAYLIVTAQATQTSYELDQLKAQNTQLLAEQDQLRYQDARMHTSAGVASAAAAAGLQHGNAPHYVTEQPVALDLGAPIGPERPADSTAWQRAVAALTGGDPTGGARAAR